MAKASSLGLCPRPPAAIVSSENDNQTFELTQEIQKCSSQQTYQPARKKYVSTSSQAPEWAYLDARREQFRSQKEGVYIAG